MIRIVALAYLVACSSASSPPGVTPGRQPTCPPCAVGDAGVVVLADARVGIDARPWDAGAVVGDAPPQDASPPNPDAAPPPPPPPPGSHPRIYLGTQRARLTQGLGRTSGVRWRAAVDKWLGGSDLWGFGAWNGALLSQLLGDARYCQKAIAVVDASVAAAEAKIRASAAPEVAGDSYLAVGEMIGDVALVYDWCFAQMTPDMRGRWIAYANQAVANVWNPKGAQWGGKVLPWTGWSIDNPSNNYFYSFVRATMLLGIATSGENASADAWIAKTRDRFALLVTVFERDLTGGGSREGTGYGVAMRRLFELYDIWKASTGEDLASKTTHTRESLATFMHQVVPTLDRVAPAGDHSRDSTAALFDYHRDYLLALIALYPSDPAAGQARTLLDSSSVPAMTQTFMLGSDLIYEPTVAAKPITLELVRHARGIGQVYARSSWSKDATWLNVTAGPYTESHAHQDQGSLMLYRGGWLVEDANLHGKSGLAQASSAHSLVRLEGVGQKANTTSAVLALRSDPDHVFVAVDVTAAYAGAASRVRRQVLWIKPDVIVIADHVTSTAAQIWQLAVPTKPVIAGAVATVTNAGHTLSVLRVTPSSGTWTAFDFRADADFSGGWRLDEATAAGDRTYVHVLTIDGIAKAAPAPSGAAVTLPDGTTGTVTFGDVGATLVRGSRTVEFKPGLDP